MTVESLYTTEVPDSGLGDLADLGGGGKGGSTGSTYVFDVDGTVSGVLFYAPVTVNGATDVFTAELWSPTGTDGSVNGTGTGTLLASKTVSVGTITGAAWNVINFDAAVSVTAGQPYRHVVHNSAGRYVAIVGYYASDHTNGNVTGYQSDHDYGGSIGTLRNNVFCDACDAGTYPNKFFNTPSYLVDTQFTAGVTTTDLTVADATQAQAADNLTLTQIHILAVDDAAQAQSADNITLTQIHELVVQDATQAQTADNVIIGIPGLPPPAERIEVIAATTRRETILAEDRMETVTR